MTEYKKHTLDTSDIDMEAADAISNSMSPEPHELKKEGKSLGDRLDNLITTVKDYPRKQWYKGVSFLKDHKLHIVAVVCLLITAGWAYDAYIGSVRSAAMQTKIEFTQARETAAKAQRAVYENASWFKRYFRSGTLKEEANQAAVRILQPAAQKMQAAGQKLEQTVTLGVFKDLPPR